jgi:hypothetical protein
VARFTAFEQFDIRDPGFSFVSDNFIEGVLIADIDITIDGITYDDAYAAVSGDASRDFELEFYGSNFADDASGNLTAGTLNALQGVDRTGEPTILYFVDGLDLDAADVFDIVLSASTTDDDALFADIFSGDDTFDLSDGDDIIQGFAGDDTINGGAGDDTAIYSGDRSDSTITANANGSFTVDGPDGTDTLIDVEFAQFDDVLLDLSTLGNPPPPPPPSGSSDLLILNANTLVGVIEGNISFVGTTTGDETVRLAAPVDNDLTASFDASFNAGGDAIQLEGDAADFTAQRSGSSVILTNGDITATIPVGTSGAAIVFDDSARTLVFDTGAGEVLLGDQVITSTAASLDATSTTTPIPLPTPSATSPDLLILNANTEIGLIEGEISVVGTTSGDETVGLFTALNGDLTTIFDASFNAGGDTVQFEGNASDYTAERSGSSVILTDGIITATVPVGTSGATILFDGGDARTLVFDTTAGEVLIGDQVITSDAATLDAAGSAGIGFEPVASAPLDEVMIADSFTAGA